MNYAAAITMNIHPALKKSPLYQLGNAVAWNEEMANNSSKSKDEKRRHADTAKHLRKTITDIFISRHIAGEYDE